MPFGEGGKYDAECAEIRRRLGSRGVLLIVVDGPKGPGFSAQATPEILATIPELLRITATSIENDLRQAQSKAGGN
jgi:hypothetical protein